MKLLTDLLVNVDAVVSETEHNICAGDAGAVGELAALLGQRDGLALTHELHVCHHLHYGT